MSTGMIRSTTGERTGFRHDLLVTTTDEVPGRRIVRVLGMVRGNSVRARHIGHDMLAVLRNVVGGEIVEYTKLLAESREQSIDRMLE